MAEKLKLIALDSTDLTIVSAHVQDAIVRAGELNYDAKSKQLVVPLRRFAWEIPGARRWLFPKKERRLSVLHFNQVESVRSIGINRESETATNVLLSLGFEPSENEDDPSGFINLVFAGGAEMIISVECVEAQLTDTGAAWGTTSRPRHKGSDQEEQHSS